MRLGDLSAPRWFEELLAEERPSVVFHTAAMTYVDGCETNPGEALRNNFEATRLVADACKKVGVFLIFFSTDYIFDGTKQGEYLETDKPHPLNIYGESKRLAEDYLREAGDLYAIFRVSWLYGLRGPSFARTILRRSRTERNFEVVCDQVGRPTYTRDLAEAFRILLGQGPRILERMNREVFHLANHGTVSWAGFAEVILKASGSAEAAVRFITTGQITRPARRPLNSVLSLEKAERLLGLRLRPWQESVVDFIAEYKASPEWQEVA